MPTKRLTAFAAAAVMIAGSAGALAYQHQTSSALSLAPTTPTGIHKIQHVVVIMQENRSFDTYFGTYPGADGIPMAERRADRLRPGPGTRQLRRSRST